MSLRFQPSEHLLQLSEPGLATAHVRAETHRAVATAQHDLPLLAATTLSDDLVWSSGGNEAEVQTATAILQVTRLRKVLGEWRHEGLVVVEGDGGHAACVRREALLKVTRKSVQWTLDSLVIL